MEEFTLEICIMYCFYGYGWLHLDDSIWNELSDIYDHWEAEEKQWVHRKRELEEFLQEPGEPDQQEDETH